MVKKTLAPTADGVGEAVPSLRDFTARLEEHGENMASCHCVLCAPLTVQTATCSLFGLTSWLSCPSVTSGVYRRGLHANV